MPRREKRLGQFLRTFESAKWNEVVTILRQSGCVVEQAESGSHWIVYHPGWPDSPQITVSVHGNRIKACYGRKIRRLLEEVAGEKGEGR